MKGSSFRVRPRVTAVVQMESFVYQKAVGHIDRTKTCNACWHQNFQPIVHDIGPWTGIRYDSSTDFLFISYKPFQIKSAWLI